jgi:membrane protease YdiL (CAAX protease family)
MESAVRIGWRDRIGASLRESRLLTIVELLAVLLFLALQAAGAIAKPKLPMLLIGWLSLWLRRVSWRQLGLARPKSWLKTVLAGVGIGLAYNALDIRVILPLLHRLTGEPLDLSGVGDLQGNVAALATLVLASWISAALAEELLYRGYLLNRVTDVFRRHATGRTAAVLLVTAAFACAHRAQGITGIADNVLAGLLFAGLYLGSGRNLWLPILVHGVIDTSSVVLLFLGFRPA